MNLIDVYIQEVIKRIPEKNRKDIALELRSTIEDMLPDEYNEEDVKTVLNQLGNPVALASGYRDAPMHLIGPRYFDVYVTLLKLILPISIVVSLISVIAEYLIGFTGDGAIINIVLEVIGIGIWRIIEVAMQVFFWFTIVFAIIERVDKGKDNEPLTTSLSKWKADELKNIPYIPVKKAITKLHVFGGLMWTAIWATLYFYSDKLIGVYEGGGEGLEFIIPAFNQDVLLNYLPFVIGVIVIEVALYLFMLLKGQWTIKIAVFNAIVEFLRTGVFIAILLNSALFNEDFTTYLSQFAAFEKWTVGGVITLFIVFGVINIVDGFRKARLPISDKSEVSV
ncbi:hypothetical protein [Fredinandcohnia sp. 179-A 10B2 NHS]|uniref:hypothetical protein n=1 Tax=Fredinandcohnia sp. 179-A 10B2 NHS TaxID=3235176 RepID=UPI0039A10C8A